MNDSSPQPRTPSEEIAGLVERVTFFNEESGFAVLRVKVRGQRELVTILGSLPSVSAGEWVTAKGWWVRDKEHGLQFKAQVLKATPPTTSEGVERYLGGGFVKGVGPVLAKKLVDHFGAGVLGVISDNPADLESVDGIGPRRRERIACRSVPRDPAVQHAGLQTSKTRTYWFLVKFRPGRKPLNHKRLYFSIPRRCEVDIK
jgi:exodeoxyribonuclease V alpha subunit